jgi:hypothetical protein
MKRLQQTSRIDQFFKKSSQDKGLKSEKCEETAKTKSPAASLKASGVAKQKMAPSFLSLEQSMNDKTLLVCKDDHFVCIKGCQILS